MTIPSQPYYVLDTPVISDVNGSFNYYYFTRGESLYTPNLDMTLDPRELSRYGYPRKVILNISDSISDISNTNGIHQNGIELLLSEVSKAESEAQLQNRNATRVTFAIDDNFLESIYNHPEFDSANDNYSAINKLINNLEEGSKDVLARVIENTYIPGPVEFNPSTNTPIAETDRKTKTNTTPIIMDVVIGDLISGVVNDPLSSFSDEFYDFEKKAQERQSDARRNITPGGFDFDDYFLSIEILDNVVLEDVGIEPFAFVIFKTRIEGDTRTPENPIILTGRNKTTIEDIDVVYGATYEYSVHTLCVVAAESTNSSIINFLLLSKNSKKVTIECIEKNPPPTVGDLSFKFLDSSTLISWNLPVETNEQLIPINDIKYVQIFERPGIDVPFKLIKMYDFNDSMLIYGMMDFVPRTLIKSTHRGDTRLQCPLPERGQIKIYSVCTVDAHGNSSFLSAQFAIQLDSLGQPKVTHIAYPGSPKQYPNLTITATVFTDSIKASGYKRMKIYHNPEFTVLLNKQNEQLLISDSLEPDVPSYVIQLIDTETQKDERIDVFINVQEEQTNGTNTTSGESNRPELQQLSQAVQSVTAQTY
tara:strand:+ start:508 stop:2280 length:1773 start_codon:yes stop_codon:yes gene_type:complete